MDPASDALFHALVSGDAAGVERALAGGADPDAVTPRGLPLCVAAAAGAADVVRALIDAGADPDVLDDDDRSPLALALAGDHREVAAILRASGAEENPSPSPSRALLRAVEADDAELVGGLLQAGALIDARDDRVPTLGMTPLMLAAALGRITALQALLVAGADVDARRDRFGSLGASALGLAAANGRVSAARRLLLAGAEVDQPGDDDETPLGAAARHDQRELVQLLLDSGASPEARDAAGRTPLLVAAGHGARDAVRALLEVGADVHATDPGQTTALASAVRRADVAMTQQLLDAGADPRWRSGEGSIAEEAFASGDPELRRIVGAALGVEHEDALRVSSRPPGADSFPPIDVDLDLGSSPGPARPDSVEELLVDDLELLPDEDPLPIDHVPLDPGRDSAATSAPVPSPDPTGFDEDAPTMGPMPAARPRPPAPRYVAPVPVSQLGKYEHPAALARLREHAEDEGFGAAAETLMAWIGVAPTDRFDTLGGMVFDVPPGSHLDLDGLQDQLLPLGALVICIGAATGSADPGRLLALPSRDPWDALAVVGTRAVRRGLSTLELIGWLKGMENRHGLNVTWVEPQRVAGRFRVRVGEPADALAADLADLSPDLVAGTGGVAAIARALRETGRFELRWPD